MKKDAERWPKIYQAYLRAFDRCLKKRVTDGLETKWKTAQEMMDWWLYGVGSTKETDQSCFIYE